MASDLNFLSCIKTAECNYNATAMVSSISRRRGYFFRQKLEKVKLKSKVISRVLGRAVKDSSL